MDADLAPPWAGRRELIRDAPINQGLLGFWPTVEAGGVRVEDMSPWRAHGTTVGGPGRVVGAAGRALNLNGSTQYVASARAQALTAFSAVAWVRLGLGAPADQAILSSMRGVDNTVLWQVSNGQTMEFWANTTVNNASSAAFADIRGGWVCVGVSWAIGRSTRFYVRGRAAGVGTTAGDIQSPITGWHLGRYGVPGARYFTGALAWVRLWGRVLPPSAFTTLAARPWIGTVAAEEIAMSNIGHNGGPRMRRPLIFRH